MVATGLRGSFCFKIKLRVWFSGKTRSCQDLVPGSIPGTRTIQIILKGHDLPTSYPLPKTAYFKEKTVKLGITVGMCV